MGNQKNNVIVYQFIDSNKVNDFTYISKLISLNTIICFDLEDSIVTDENFKASKQRIFDEIKLFVNTYHIQNFGIRLNLSNINIVKNDLCILREIVTEQHIQIFLPKLAFLNDIDIIIEQIKFSGFVDFELIPIIETKLGMDHLEEFLHASSQYSNKFAFGHCDYNLDCNIFPFYHQNSKEYWVWIENISLRIPHNFIFINSPYLKLDDENDFKKMLQILNNMFQKFGQITLSIRQSIACQSFHNKSNKVDLINKEYIPKQKIIPYAESFIKDFESNKKINKNFAIIEESKILLSPQEYYQAKIFLNQNDTKKS